MYKYICINIYTHLWCSILDFSGKGLPVMFLAFQDDIFKFVEILII